MVPHSMSLAQAALYFTYAEKHMHEEQVASQRVAVFAL